MPQQNEKIQEKILIIKLGALGDFIQALGPMSAIRKHHTDAQISLLTTKPFATFGETCPYIDNVIIDKKPKTFDIYGWINLRKTLIKNNFTRVYDLQNNDRTGLYFNLIPKSKKPEWVGIAKGASHQNASPERTAGHAFDGHVQTLGLAGIKNIEVYTLSWINEDLSNFDLKKPYILMVPGCAPQHPHKRWPAKSYGALAQTLTDKGFQIILLGTKSEKDITDEIQALCPTALNLTDQTTLFQIASLAHNASAAIGNDTGPMHIIGPTGCPSLILFSGQSTPMRHAPKGKEINTIQEQKISDITPDQVTTEILKILKKEKT